MRECYGIYAIEAYRFHARTVAMGSAAISALTRAERKDFMAASEAIGQMERMANAGEMLKCLRMVYCEDAGRELRRGEISERVTRASLIIPMSERQIYQNLKKARSIFVELRDLRK
ncbi:MAG: hypothetical protein LBD02_10700 [Christensenellaceae bacterium]|nr:hypothetical protein [Christensenellaceae bacterium]